MQTTIPTVPHLLKDRSLRSDRGGGIHPETLTHSNLHCVTVTVVKGVCVCVCVCVCVINFGL